MFKIKVLIFFIPIFLIIVYWKDTIMNISDHLYDWNDSLYTIWIIQNNINHFKNLDLQHIYDTSAMYPFRYSLSFAEHFYFPSLIIFLISQFTKNPIIQLNILLVINHILIFLSFYLLIGLFTKYYWSKIISSFYLSFSPYFFSQLGHIHMIFFWPFLLALFFLFKAKNNSQVSIKNLLLAGLMLGLQFTTSAYLGIMGVAIIVFYFSTRLLFGEKIVILSKELFIFIVIFLITASVSIYGYLLAKNTYGGQRDIREYLIYSAHSSDYIFTQVGQTSFFYQNIPIFGWWRSFDHHNTGEKASFIGLLPIVIIFMYLFKLKRYESNLSFSLNLNKFTLFLVIMGLAGFIFSLGPRLSINGTYLHIPLPYYLVLKYVPFIESLRALARWFFLVTLATAFLVGLGLDKFLNNSKKFRYPINNVLIGSFIFILFIMEFYPKPIMISKKDWWDAAYGYMKNELCIKNNPVVLEYPFVYRNIDANIIKDLQYKTNILLASTQHNCKILSGFSGYEPPEYIKIKEQLDSEGIDKNDVVLMRKLGMRYFKLNKFAITKDEKIALTKVLTPLGLRLVYSDNQVNIYNIVNQIKQIPH